MKKIFFTLLALVGTMSMNAQVIQVMNIMKNGEVVATFTADQADEVVFKEVPAPTTGTAERTGGVNVNWVQLWKDGPKFAEYNVGATSATEYGGYYNWGKNTNKDASGVYKSGTDALTGTDDTATALWGSKWRMPTQTEFQALIDNCTCTWDATNKGLVCTGKDAYASNSIFLPAAGYCFDGDGSDQGTRGYYWSSTPDGSFRACTLSFYSGYQCVFNNYRDNGSSVRAVLAE